MVSKVRRKQAWAVESVNEPLASDRRSAVCFDSNVSGVVGSGVVGSDDVSGVVGSDDVSGVVGSGVVGSGVVTSGKIGSRVVDSGKVGSSVEGAGVGGSGTAVEGAFNGSAQTGLPQSLHVCP